MGQSEDFGLLELSDFTENHMVCDWQVYISFRLWFNTVIGYRTCLLFWDNFITFVLYLHTHFHVSVSLLCSERLQNCVVFSSLKLLWIKVSAKWINVNVNIKNVKVWIWALKIGLISAELILPIRRIHKLRRAPETPGDPLALKDVLIIVLFLSLASGYWKHEWSFLLMRCAVTLST